MKAKENEDEAKENEDEAKENKAVHTARDASSTRLKMTRDRRTYGRTDTPSYRDATAHLEIRGRKKKKELKTDRPGPLPNLQSSIRTQRASEPKSLPLCRLARFPRCPRKTGDRPEARAREAKTAAT